MTFAWAQSVGNFPVWRNLSKVIFIIGAISSLSSLSKRGLILSGSGALPGLRFFSKVSGIFQSQALQALSYGASPG